MNGYCEQCGKYAQPLAKLPDGTDIYRCYECGRVWGERLVVFDVSYALAERDVGACLTIVDKDLILSASAQAEDSGVT